MIPFAVRGTPSPLEPIAVLGKATLKAVRKADLPLTIHHTLRELASKEANIMWYNVLCDAHDIDQETAKDIVQAMHVDLKMYFDETLCTTLI